MAGLLLKGEDDFGPATKPVNEMVPAKRMGGPARSGPVATVLVVMSACASVVHGQAEGLEGTWRAGATTMNVSVESWGADCGPQPRSSRSKGGGTVRIRRSGGHLVIQGRNHVVRTDACWSRNPAMRRLSSAYLDGTWTTQCKTPKSDARAEHGTYTIAVVNPSRLQYRDVSRYNWQLKSSRCVATITTVQALEQQSVAGPQRKTTRTGAPSIKPLPEPTSTPACSPGAPSVLRLRPRRAELELGGRLCFRGRVVDAAGCEIPGAPVTFGVSHDPALSAAMERNCFHASDSAAEGEGEFRVLARSGQLKAQSQVTVRAVDLSGLIAMRVETGGVTGFDADEQPASVETRDATRVSAGPATPPRGSQGTQSGHFRLFGTLIGSVAVLLLLALWLRVRLKPKVRAIPHAETAGSPEQAPTREPAAPDETWICPSCRIGYPAALRTCPKCVKGETKLIPYAEFNRRAKPSARAKRCRSCGEEVGATANFCTGCGSRDLTDTGADR